MKYYTVKEEKKILHKIKRRKANWIGHILRKNGLVKHVIKGQTQVKMRREDEEEDVSGYWMTLRKIEDIEYWKRKH
jgi:hypothetical protein